MGGAQRNVADSAFYDMRRSTARWASDPRCTLTSAEWKPSARVGAESQVPGRWRSVKGCQNMFIEIPNRSAIQGLAQQRSTIEAMRW